MKCDVCASDNLEGAAYCEDCGAKLVVAHAAVASSSSASAVVSAPPPPPTPQPAAGGGVHCPSCGATNPETEMYCVDCGANLGTSADAGTPPPVMPVSTAPPMTSSAAVGDKAVRVGRLALASGAKEFRLDKEINTIGRRSPADQIEPDIDLTNDDPDSYVSRRHAQILRADDHYVYEDVGSSNGSFVNNVRLVHGVQQLLKDKDAIRVGKTEFIFHEL